MVYKKVNRKLQEKYSCFSATFAIRLHFFKATVKTVGSFLNWIWHISVFGLFYTTRWSTLSGYKSDFCEEISTKNCYIQFQLKFWNKLVILNDYRWSWPFSINKIPTDFCFKKEDRSFAQCHKEIPIATFKVCLQDC